MAKLSLSRIMKAVESGEYVGFCLACKTKVSGVEPDARKYVCPKCKAPKVYGAEELLLMAA